MTADELFIGQTVAHVRGDFTGIVEGTMVPDEPFPVHALVSVATGGKVYAPVNQLVDATPPPEPPPEP